VSVLSVIRLFAVVLVVAAGGITPAGATSGDTGTIAFVREVDEQGIWLVESNGSETRLTNGQDYRPDWSPDGRWIAFQ